MLSDMVRLNAVIAGLLLTLAVGCQTRADALDALCDAPSTCGAPCQTGDARARSAAMRAHLDVIIENDSVRQIYREYWAGADRATLDTMARAAMSEERGTPDCAYFSWHRTL